MPSSHQMWRLRPFFLILALIAAPGSGFAEPARIGAVTHAEQAGGGRIVLELSRRVEPRTFLLDEPMRLVLDLADAIWALAAAPTPAGLVAGYRYGQAELGRARLVVDLSQPARIRRVGYDLASPQRPRLVIELEPIGRTAFAAEVQPWVPSGDLLRSVATLPPAAPVAAAPPPARSPSPSPPQAVTAPPTAAPAARPAPRAQARRPMVVIDPGHGGSDPGTIGASGAQEKNVTLAMAREIRRALEASGRYGVRLTRDTDEFVRLRERIARARGAKADLFVSVHADSIGSSETRGASVYTLSDTASDAEAAALAQRENRADIIAGVDLSNESKDVASILIDLAQRETMNGSARFAQLLVAELGKDVRVLPNNPHRFAGFAVLKAPDTPAVLIELGYLSNQQDEALLRQHDHRRRVAAALLRAVDAFFAQPGRAPAGRS